MIPRCIVLFGALLPFLLLLCKAQSTPRSCADEAINSTNILIRKLLWDEQYWFDNQTVKFKAYCADQGDQKSGSYAKCHLMKWMEDQRHRAGHVNVDNEALVALYKCKNCETLDMPAQHLFAKDCVDAAYQPLVGRNLVLDMGIKMQARVDRFQEKCGDEATSFDRTYVDCSIRQYEWDALMWQWPIENINIIIQGLTKCVIQRTPINCANQAIDSTDKLVRKLLWDEQWWFDNQTVKFKAYCLSEGDRKSGSYAKCHLMKWIEDQRHRAGHVNVDNEALFALYKCKNCQTLKMPKDHLFAKDCVDNAYKPLVGRNLVLDMGIKMQKRCDRFQDKCDGLDTSFNRTYVDCSIREFEWDALMWQWPIENINIIIKGLEKCVKEEGDNPTC